MKCQISKQTSSDSKLTSNKIIFFSLLFTSEELNMDGLEYQIMEAYASHHNASLIFSFEPDQWGDVFPNGTGIGALGRIASYEAEFAIGFIFL